ncbi:MAG: hypothetical protein HY665_01200 [Chloroflexi bacterium]|nr:hypothetical protein [Chloroflexota bacterium]
MAEFIKTYGIWIVLGLLLLVIVLRRGRGHEMSQAHHDQTSSSGETKKEETGHSGHGSCCH